MASSSACLLCGASAPIDAILSPQGGVVAGGSRVDCRSCGLYVLHGSGAEALAKASPEAKRRIAEMVRERNRTEPDNPLGVNEWLVLKGVTRS